MCGIPHIPDCRPPMLDLVRLEHQSRIAHRPAGMHASLTGCRSPEIPRLSRLLDVEDHGPEIPVREIGTGRRGVRPYRVHQEVGGAERRAEVELTTAAPVADLDR